MLINALVENWYIGRERVAKEHISNITQLVVNYFRKKTLHHSRFTGYLIHSCMGVKARTKINSLNNKVAIITKPDK